MIVRADALRIPLPDQSVDLVVGSPPYIDARLYLESGKDLGISRGLDAWVEWMLAVTTEALRVSKGLVVWVCAGVTRDRTYQPGPEALLADWVRRGGSAYRPVIWHRVGIPGSGGDEWFRGDTEYCLAFKRPGKLPWSDNVANGHPPKWAPGGEMSHRLSDGNRRNQWGGSEKSAGHTTADGTKADFTRPSHRMASRKELAASGAGRLISGQRGEDDGEVQAYIPPVKANPGNLFKTTVGGGQLGHTLAHSNEAPYPIDVPAWFIASHCPPGGLVLDCFGGSGTTGQAAMESGRRYILTDLRQSQCLLSRKRLRTVTPALPMFAEAAP